MQVTLKESEIARGVELYLNSRGVITEGMDMSVQFSMGKGINGLKVQVDIEPKEGTEVSNTKLLATVQDEDKPEPSPTSIAGKIKSHTAEVQAAKEEEAKASPVLTKRQMAAVVAAEGKAAVAAAAELPVETPAPQPEPVFHGGDVNPNADEGGEVSDETQGTIAAEDQPDAGQPEPAKPAGRKPIFGKKTVAPAPVIEPDPEPTQAAAEAAGSDEPPFLVDDAQPSDEEVAAQLAQPTPAARRPVASLFAKKA